MSILNSASNSLISHYDTTGFRVPSSRADPFHSFRQRCRTDWNRRDREDGGGIARCTGKQLDGLLAAARYSRPVA